MRKVSAILFLLVACNHRPSPREFSLKMEDSALHFINGIWYYNKQLFSGTLTGNYPNGKLERSAHYILGKESGWEETYFDNGTLLEKRYYTAGEKDSVHLGFWENGNKRFEYHFLNGIYNGDYIEWYKGGQLFKHLHFIAGVDDWGKAWRQNGKLYMNFAVKNGRRYGLNNSNLCYSVRNGAGEYSKSIQDSIPK